MDLNGFQWFSVVFWEAISINSAIEIMPNSLCIQTCELPFADHNANGKLPVFVLGATRNV